ncbi:MAG: hypothetical protein ACT4PE_13030 [Candidatus Eiseniibacteriota bacterium]
MRNARRGIAALLLLAALGAAAAAVRSARAPAGGLDALEAALVAAPRGTPDRSGEPALVLLIDPDCAACRAAEEDLRLDVRPGEFGVHTFVLSRADPRFAPVFEALGHGLVPAYVFLDARGRPRAVLRGRRPPPLVRAWLEEALAGSFEPPGPNVP